MTDIVTKTFLKAMEDSDYLFTDANESSPKIVSAKVMHPDCFGVELKDDQVLITPLKPSQGTILVLTFEDGTERWAEIAVIVADTTSSEMTLKLG